MKYPDVVGEWETMRAVADGASLARFGDGELKVMDGHGYVRQQPDRRLAAELERVLNDPPPGLAVGIPTMDPAGPKYPNWRRHIPRFERYLHRRGAWYSAFVTRPDSAPWIETPDYLALCVTVWGGRDVVAVMEDTNPLLPVLYATAGAVRHVPCPRYQCYDAVADLEAAVLVDRPAVAVYCAGVTATCLAARTAAAGVQSVDFGSGGKLLSRLFAGAAAVVPVVTAG